MSDDELLDKASKLFSRFGKGVKGAGRAVTGIGLGSLRVSVPVTRYAPGDKITGTLSLTLPQPTDGKALRVSLIATQRTIQTPLHNPLSRHPHTGPTTSTSVAYRFDLELSGERSYLSTVLPFELSVPPDALDLRPSAGSSGGGQIGDVVRAVASVVAPTTGPIQWRVIGLLHIPWSRNLEHVVDLQIGRA